MVEQLLLQLSRGVILEGIVRSVEVLLTTKVLLSAVVIVSVEQLP